MSPQEQLFIELVNRARADPLAEVARNSLVSDLNQEVEEGSEITPEPKQPLAPHQALTDAMIVHVNDMLNRDFFAHDNPDGESPSDRALAAGYPTGAGENIAWSGNAGRPINENQEVYLRHDGLFESVGHRVNMMRESWREIGAGIRYGAFTSDSVVFGSSIMSGTLFGNRGGEFFITGVALDDRVTANNFYEIGEGLASVRITAVNQSTNEVYTVTTGSSGGYSIQVPDGLYSLTATGGRISRPLEVDGVVVAGENVKVDFNSRLMNTRSLEGNVYEDTNGSGTFDAGELALANRTVYLDSNGNEVLDESEFQVQTNAQGEYAFENLLPGEYVVRQVVPEGWRQPSEGAFFVNTAQRSWAGLNFPVEEVEVNQPPTANADVASVKVGEQVSIDVAGNDSDPENRLVTSTIQIQSPPQHGQASVSNGRVVYLAGNQFVGNDQFSYTIADENGVRSEAATVSVTIGTDRPWKNHVEARDVDNSGGVSPRDVLVLVNEINRAGSHSLSGRVRNDSEPYYDVNGDNFLSAVDVLLVVLLLNSANESGSGEPPVETVVPDDSDMFFAMLAEEDEDRGV